MTGSEKLTDGLSKFDAKIKKKIKKKKLTEKAPEPGSIGLSSQLFRRVRQEDHKSQFSLGYIARP